MTGRRPSRLAKLSRPRLHHVVTLPRLCDLVERIRERPFVWVSGPPGAGKTTLVAEYSRCSGLRTLWFLLDPADSDPATFFYYLRESVTSESRTGKSRLPLFTPEYRDDLCGFGRRFFRDLFHASAQDVLIVFDNYQELSAESGIHAVLAACIDEIPEGSNIVVLSRTEPSAEYARAVMNGRVGRLDWDDLRLTRAETEAIAQARGISSTEHLEGLHSRSGSWLAGVVLLSEQWRKSGSVQVEGTDTMQTVFDYFAGEILDSVSTAVQDVLLRTSLLPRVTRATAAAVCDTNNAIDHVERLHRRKLFTDRVQGSVATYRYHALFRSFLEARLALRVSEGERRTLLRKAARAFEVEGGVEDAFLLYVEGREASSAERLFVAHVPRLIAQGRWRVVGDWHSALCGCIAAVSPWVTYWLGRSLAAVQPQVARRIQESSYEAFVSCSDSRGQILSCGGVLEALYFQYEYFREMDTWIDRIEGLLKESTVFQSADEGLWVHSAFLMACAHRRPDRVLMKESMGAVQRLVHQTADVNAKVTAATMLHYFGYTALDTGANRLAMDVARPLLPNEELTAYRAALYLGEEGYAHYAFGRFNDALQRFDEALVLVRQNGFKEMETRIMDWRGFCQRRAGLSHAAAETVREIERSGFPGRGFSAALLELLRAYVEFTQGDIDRAIDRSESALAVCDAVGQTRTQVLALTIHAGMLIEASRGIEAAPMLDAAAKLSEGTVLEHLRGAVSLMRAFAALRAGDQEASGRHVAEMIGWSRFEKERIGILWYRPILAQVLQMAAGEGLDEDSVIRLAEEAGLKPVPGMSDRWPWPVKIYALGRFEVLIDGKPLAFGRKAPKRVIELLKLMIASGGESVEERLMDVLWPHLDGDAAHKALGALLHRLRRLLGRASVVRQQAGRLWLDRELCWTDVSYFERATAAGADPGGHPGALTAYQGPFLPDDDALPWVLPMRENMRRRYVEKVRQRAARLEAAGEIASAAQCLLHAVEVDGSESLRKELARCWTRLGRAADAESLTGERFVAAQPAPPCGDPHASRRGETVGVDSIVEAAFGQTVSNL